MNTKVYKNSAEDKTEIKILNEAKKTETNVRMLLRYNVLLLHMRGYSNSHISKIFEITPKTVGSYIKSYTKNGITGLIPAKSSGNPKKLSDEQEAKLYECISGKTPTEVGVAPFVNWTAPLACQWVLREFSISFSERGMRDVFYRLKLSYTRPTYTLKKADIEQQKEFKSDFAELKKS